VRDLLTKVFWPVLKWFETGEDPVKYKPSYRVVLYIVGSLFLLLSGVSALAGYTSGELSAGIPVVVFFAVGSVALILAALGSNAAVAKIWGIKK